MVARTKAATRGEVAVTEAAAGWERTSSEVRSTVIVIDPDGDGCFALVTPTAIVFFGRPLALRPQFPVDTGGFPRFRSLKHDAVQGRRNRSGIAPTILSVEIVPVPGRGEPRCRSLWPATPFLRKQEVRRHHETDERQQYQARHHDHAASAVGTPGAATAGRVIRPSWSTKPASFRTRSTIGLCMRYC